MCAESLGKWRDAATLIIAARCTVESQKEYDYQLLMTTRARRTALAANHCVFPGGVLDKQGDENAEWLQYFEQFGVSDDMLQALIIKQIFQCSEVNCARELSIRLKAIRETFEEVGLLLCRSREQLRDKAPAAFCLMIFRSIVGKTACMKIPGSFCSFAEHCRLCLTCGHYANGLCGQVRLV
ncbi:nucleoside diphosphate-linked moiety X motif 19-like [Scaptodrosophila lebanonensis]|uniref:Nucleoside diphosphate-linked moiety X motif 19-like n=1 Tax=Drosophila lebanonensis TaxID=7225 RepID=A0A6J2TPK9_DROLE|nr:nucleoside diphosphate-linked moiety X motif 19-like [Scaptodrosophila lebanonensis]